jgi:hypothetical protein
MSDLRSVIQGLRELNAKRTQGEWHSVNLCDTWFVLQDGPNYDDADLLKGGDDYEVKRCVGMDKAKANSEFCAALANACPKLLDLAEKGLEAEAIKKICEANETLHWRLVDLFDKGARGVSPLHFVEAEIVKLQAKKEPYLLLMALNDTKAKLAAAEAERDRLIGLLVEWHAACELMGGDFTREDKVAYDHAEILLTNAARKLAQETNE